MAAAALLLGAFAVVAWADPPTSAPSLAVADLGAPVGDTNSNAALAAAGQPLFEEACSSCHGFAGEGVEGQGPSLEAAGEAAADFYLRTGRMPLDQVGEEPLRGEPAYGNREIEALVAYVGALGNGPPIPKVRPAQGSLSEGFQLFAESCEGCHGVGGKGGVAIGGYAPPLGEATPTEVGEAIRIGPYIMPRFGPGQLSDDEVDSVARYVQLVQNPDDAGGFGIGHIGPVPEGLVAWAAAIAALMVVARLIGDRNRGEDESGEEGR